MATQKQRKGALLEDLVAELHSIPGVSVHRRLRLPSLTGRRQREIDVLVEAKAAGYPVRLALECKNEKKLTGVEKIDAFVGKLKDVGIPPSYGIYVSAKGYTKGARERAKSAGLRALMLEGLSEDSLQLALTGALQSTVILMPRVATLSRFDDVVDSESPTQPNWLIVNLDQSLGHGLGAIYQALWQMWRDGSIQPVIGEHVIFMRLPNGFRFSSTEQGVNWSVVIADVLVAGHVLTVSGSATSVVLKNAESGAVERARVTASWSNEPDSLKLQSVKSEAELADVLLSRRVPHLWTRIRAPRIATNKAYWPLSQAAILRLQELQKGGKEASLESVEGLDISTAWELPAHLGSA